MSQHLEFPTRRQAEHLSQVFTTEALFSIWKDRIMTEPKTTAFVRNLGLCTNPYMEPLVLNIDEIWITGLLMTPMNTLP